MKENIYVKECSCQLILMTWQIKKTFYEIIKWLINIYISNYYFLNYEVFFKCIFILVNQILFIVY